jgi:hypothetical protein
VTEVEWLSCTDPQKMLEHLEDRASARKLRLFAVACCRKIWHLLPDQDCRKAVQIAEGFAEGKAGINLLREVEGAGAFYSDHREDVPEERLGYYAGGAIFQLGQERLASDLVADAASNAVACSTLDAGGGRLAVDAARHGEAAVQCHLLRDIVGNPFRPVRIDPAWLSRDGGLIPKLAQAVHDRREFPSGHLDPARLAVLTDALEDAGCDNADLLGHLRASGPHVRGCWAVDSILGKQ